MTFPIPNPDKTGEVSVHTIEERTEYVLRGRFARIATPMTLRESSVTPSGACAGGETEDRAPIDRHTASAIDATQEAQGPHDLSHLARLDDPGKRI